MLLQMAYLSCTQPTSGFPMIHVFADIQINQEAAEYQ